MFFTAAVVEADPEADLPWLATAYVPAPSLARLVLACGPLPVTAVRWLAAGCAEALESIHGAGLVHRDLKPSNVLVAPDGPRVIDFGVARAAERMGRTTSRGAVGTPAYMAPEQARDTHEASVASDVYSLGATLLFAATGHPPYRGATVMDVLARLATEEPDLSGLPDELTELITACMHRVPRQRPTSSAMLAQLGDFTEAQVGPDEEHAYLPEEAMALIGEYQRSPQLFAPPLGEDRGDDATVRLLHRTSRLLQARPPAPPRRAGSRVTPGPGAESGWRQWVRSHLAWVGWASVGAALVVAGVILGASLTSSSTPTVRPAADRQSRRIRCAAPRSGQRRSDVCMNQSQGDPSTAFVVEGSGFAPRTPVTVTLTELDPPQRADLQTNVAGSSRSPARTGRFKVPVSQLYPGSLPLGLFTVEVTGSGGRATSTQFMCSHRGRPPLARR